MTNVNDMTNPFVAMEDHLVERISSIVVARVTEEIMQAFNIKRQEAKYYSRVEVSRLLKMSLPTIDKLVREGTLQSVKIGRRVLFPSELVDNLVGKTDLKYQRK